MAREVTNRIQRLRKSSGISIDDQIEVYFKIESEEAGALPTVLDLHSDKIEG